LIEGGQSWHLERQQGPARRLHGRSVALAGVEADGARTVRVLQVDRPALVLGSSQPESDVDTVAAEAAGVDVVRRRSGGAAVLVDPAAVVWVDLIVPAGDPLWEADVGMAGWWVGDAWAAALDGVGAGPAQVWRGPMQSSAWSARVCFAGVGPGEVLIGARKLVGISQRRTRGAALFQTAALLTWDPAALLALLHLDAGERAQGLADLERVAVGVGTQRGEALVAALLAALPPL
jgi:lipoate-protein ligase A